MPDQIDPIDRAIGHLPLRRRVLIEGREVEVAFLLRTRDWRPLRADWWRGTDVSVIGADLMGNFFLRHCDGSVRYWHHAEATDTIIAPNVRDFVASLQE
jgi:hypothetical protein